MQEISFVISGTVTEENRLGPERLSVVIRFGSDKEPSEGFAALCETVAASLEGKGLKLNNRKGATNVSGYIHVGLDDKGAPGSEYKSVDFKCRTDHSVYGARDILVKAMEDADLRPLN